MGVKLAPVQRLHYFAADGITPAGGGKIFTYLAGTTTKTATYTTSTGAVANTNPIILNSAGRAPFGVWLTEGINYKFVQAPSTDTDPPVSPIFTEDNVNGTNDLSGVSQWVSSGVTPSYQSVAAFTLAGDQTADFHIGRRIRITQTSGFAYFYIENSVFTTLTTVTIRSADGSINAGISVVDLSFLPANNHAIPLFPSNRLPATINTLVSGGALTITVPPMVLDFRANNLALSGAVSYASSNLTLTVPSGATLGAVNGKKFRLIVGVMNNNTVGELFVINAVLGNFLDESGPVITTAISASSNSDSISYSGIERLGRSFRILGYIDFTLTTAGTWNVLPSKTHSIIGDAPLNAPAGFRAFAATGQSIAATTDTKVTLASELYDTEEAFTASTYTCKTPGLYLICAGLGFTTFVSATSSKLTLRNAGTQVKAVTGYSVTIEAHYLSLSTISRLAPGDTLDLYIFLTFAQTLLSGDNATYFTVHRIA